MIGVVCLRAATSRDLAARIDLEDTRVAPCSLEEALADVKDPAGELDVLVIGPDVSNPLRIVQRVHAEDASIPALIVTEPDMHPVVEQALRFAPFLGDEVRCARTDAPLRDEVRHLLDRRRIRADYRRTLNAANEALQALSPRSRGPAYVLDRLLAQAPVGVAVLDPEGSLLIWNPRGRQILGLSEATPVGTPLFTCFPESEHGALRNLLDQANVTSGAETPPRAVLRCNARNERRFVELAVGPFEGRDGHGTLVIVHDMTDRRRAEAELEEARRVLAQREQLAVLGVLVSGVAHEARTPLTYIQNHVGLLRLLTDRHRDALRQAGAEALEEALDTSLTDILSGLDRINNLVNDLRGFARVQPGRRDRTALGPVVQDALGLFTTTDRSGIRVAFEQEPAPDVPLDPAQVQQVVLNLVENAVQAVEAREDPPPSPVPVRVRVRGIPDGGGAVLEVADDGVGVPPENQDQIFEPLFTTKPQGTGLGLAILKRIVDEHDGTLHLHSEPGKGTRFTVTFPG